MVVEVEVPLQPVHCISHVLIVSDIHLLLLDTAPKPLYEYVVQRPPPTIHADTDLFGEQTSGEVQAGELCSLVRVEHLWPAAPHHQRLIQRL